MAYFPPEVFKNIMSFVPDHLRDKQKRIWDSIVPKYNVDWRWCWSGEEDDLVQQRHGWICLRVVDKDISTHINHNQFRETRINCRDSASLNILGDKTLRDLDKNDWCLTYWKRRDQPFLRQIQNIMNLTDFFDQVKQKRIWDSITPEYEFVENPRGKTQPRGWIYMWVKLKTDPTCIESACKESACLSILNDKALMFLDKNDWCLTEWKRQIQNDYD